MLFGDVGEVQEVREAARHGQRRLDRHRPQLVGQRARSRRPPVPVLRALGERADPLDPLEVRDALVAAQRFAEQLAEQPDVVAERLVRIVGLIDATGFAESVKRGPQ